MTGIQAVTAQRAERDPELVPVAKRPGRPAGPRGPLRHGRRLLRPAQRRHRPVGDARGRGLRRHGRSPRRRGAVPLPGHRPRHLPPLRLRPDLRLPQGRHPPAAAGLRGRGGVAEPVGRVDGTPQRRGVHLRPGRWRRAHRRRHRRRRARPRRRPLRAAHHRRLRCLGRDRHRRQGTHLPWRLRHPGDARLRRRAHPRDGLRVPRRPRALRPALAPLRRAARPRRLPRPHAHQRLRRRPRDRPVRRARPRPGRLADVPRLARTRLADPRGHLLEVDGALLARRAAAVHQPAGREQQALRALPAEEELLRRHGLDPPAGTADARLRALRRRAVRRPRRGLVPHRHQPVPGPPGDQRGQARRGDGHRDLDPVQVHDEARRPPVRRRLHRRPARRGAPDGRAPDGAGQQVRQRPVRRGRRRGLDRPAGQRRQLPGDRVLLGDGALRARRRGQARPGAVRRPGRHRRPSSRTRSSGPSPQVSGRAAGAALRAARSTATGAASPTSAGTWSAGSPSAA